MSELTLGQVGWSPDFAVMERANWLTLMAASEKPQPILERIRDRYYAEGFAAGRSVPDPRAAALEAENGRLRALTRYAVHDRDCLARDRQDCSCGYSAALAPQSGDAGAQGREEESRG